MERDIIPKGAFFLMVDDVSARTAASALSPAAMTV